MLIKIKEFDEWCVWLVFSSIYNFCGQLDLLLLFHHSNGDIFTWQKNVPSRIVMRIKYQKWTHFSFPLAHTTWMYLLCQICNIFFKSCHAYKVSVVHSDRNYLFSLHYWLAFMLTPIVYENRMIWLVPNTSTLSNGLKLNEIKYIIRLFYCLFRPAIGFLIQFWLYQRRRVF